MVLEVTQRVPPTCINMCHTESTYRFKRGVAKRRLLDETGPTPLRGGVGGFVYARRRLVAGRDAILRVGNAGTGGVAVPSKTRGGFVDWQCFPAPGFGPKTSFATGGWGVQVRLKKMNHSFKMNQNESLFQQNEVVVSKILLKIEKDRNTVSSSQSLYVEHQKKIQTILLVSLPTLKAIFVQCGRYAPSLH